jgi:SAM-dependent methyltransferase
MKTADRVRQSYERYPYPFGNAKALKGRSWNLDLKWVEAIGRVETPNAPPARVLVAGCGDGTEAFNLQRMLPRSEIVAVDFSARSIGIAKRLQRRDAKMRAIRFVEADLADRRLPARLGEFDLITCQGVLSYFTRPTPVLRNLGECLKSDGVLYIGVNGSNHASTRLRPSLRRFGFDLNEYSNKQHQREVLKLCDTVLAADGHRQVSQFGSPYLASDVFGPLNQCLSLADWISLARRAGLHFRGNQASTRLFRGIADKGLYHLLIPRSRGQVCEILDQLSPAPFHQLLFSRTPEANPPWQEGGRLLRWSIALTPLYEVRLPRPGKKVLDRVRNIRIASPSRNIAMEWAMPEWELELLRDAGSGHSLASLLRECPLRVPFRELRNQLYLLYQLGVINLVPSPGGKRSLGRGRSRRRSSARPRKK